MTSILRLLTNSRAEQREADSARRDDEIVQLSPEERVEKIATYRKRRSSAARVVSRIINE